MGENFGNKDFRINDDGTIVRGRKCPKCGKESYSEGTHCEHCGARMDGNASTPKDGHNWWIWLLLVLILAGITIPIGLSLDNNSSDFYYNYDSEPIETVEQAAEEVWLEYQDCPEEQVYMEHYAAQAEMWAE